MVELINYIKISILSACMASISACSTLYGNANKLNSLSARCIVVVPMAIGESDANVIKLSGQICKDSNSPLLWQKLSQQLFAIGKYDKAVQAANATLKLQPDNAIAKDIALRSGLKITEKSLTQMKGNMQFLYGDAWSEANQVAGQISRARGEKPLDLNQSTSTNLLPAEQVKKPVSKRQKVRTTKPKKHAPVKQTTRATKPEVVVKPKVTSPTKPSGKPSNPFSSFN